MKTMTLALLLAFSLPAYSQEAPREMRAAWIATVFNIDWPPQKDAPSQKQELSALLDTLSRLNFNAVIVQVKPASDAFYQSDLSPWSRYLTGTQGKDPGFDPLAYFIEESRKRGLEVHAWVNPFRVLSGEKWDTLAADHIARRKPEWVIEYGGRFYFDPGNPEVRARVITEILEIVRNYDIDALHMDDYFYPYRVGRQEFGDSVSFQKYGKGLDIGSWRRQNTEAFVAAASSAIKKEKSHVRFGISPFGVWRNSSVDPRGSETQAGQTNYDDLFADILAWVQKGYVDYLVPQLYWDFDNKSAPFGVLADWWSQAAGGKTQLYLGLGVYRLGETAEPSMISRQMDYLRRDNNIQGAAFYSAKWISQNTKNVQQTLKEIFPTPALLPAFEGKAPGSPQPQLKDGFLHWKAVPKAWSYAVYGAPEGTEEQLLAVLHQRGGSFAYPAQEGWGYKVSALSRSHNESPKAEVLAAPQKMPRIKPAPNPEANTTEKLPKKEDSKKDATTPLKPIPPAKPRTSAAPPPQITMPHAPEVPKAPTEPSVEKKAAQALQKSKSEIDKHMEEIFAILKERIKEEYQGGRL